MKKLIIILDPAHGEEVPGKRSPDGTHREYLWSRNIIGKLKPRLEKLGFNVYLTTTLNSEPGLTHRQQSANAIKLDTGCTKFLLSLHNNAAGNGSDWAKASGVEIFTSKGHTQSDEFAEVIMKQLMADFPTYKFRKGANNSLVKDENFTVLMGYGYKAALLEWLFQDNKEDVELLKSEDINNKLVDSLEKALVQIEITLNK